MRSTVFALAHLFALARSASVIAASLAVFLAGIAYAAEDVAAGDVERKLPIYQGVNHREFAQALLESGSEYDSIDELLAQLKESKAIHSIRYPAESSPFQVEGTVGYVHVLISPVRSVLIYFDRDRKVKRTRVVNTYL